VASHYPRSALQRFTLSIPEPLRVERWSVPTGTGSTCRWILSSTGPPPFINEVPPHVHSQGAFLIICSRGPSV